MSHRFAMTGAVALVLGSCGILGPDIDATGAVEYLDLEGGCWLLRTGEGVFDPVNLDEAFRVDGLAVRFEADYRRDLSGFCPGEIVELKSIERL